MGEPAQRVPFVGLTGGLGAGKSTALEALADQGAATLSTDAVVHELLETAEVRDAVAARLGADVLGAQGLDRAVVAGRVFERSEDREWLESLLWPRVAERVAAWHDEVDRAEPPPCAAVVEVPLLFEADMAEAFDATIAVIAADEARSSRAAARGHTAVMERHDRQLSQEEKSQRADFTVVNDGTVGELRSELSRVLLSIRG